MKTKLELLSEELQATQQKMVKMEEAFNRRIEELTIYIKRFIDKGDN